MINKIKELDDTKIIDDYMKLNEINIQLTNNKKEILILEENINKIQKEKIVLKNYNLECNHCRENKLIDELNKDVIIKQYNELIEETDKITKLINISNAKEEYDTLLLKKQELINLEKQLIIYETGEIKNDSEIKNIVYEIEILIKEIDEYDINEENIKLNKQYNEEIKSKQEIMNTTDILLIKEYNNLKDIDQLINANLYKIIEFGDIKMNLTNKINELRDYINEYNKDIENIKINKIINTEIQNNEKEIIKNQNEAYLEYDILIIQIKKNDKLSELFSIQNIDIQNNEKNIIELNNEIRELNINIKEHEEYIKNIEINKSKDKEILELKYNLNNENKAALNNLSLNALNNQKVLDINENIIILENEIIKLNDYNKELNYYNILCSAFDKHGISLMVITNHLDYITNRVNHTISSYIDKKVKLTIKEHEIILTFINTDSDRPTRLLGGAETFIIDLAFKIVFSEISQISRSDILFIDEGISVLDKEKICNFDNMVSFLQKHFNKTFLITHIEAIEDFISTKLDINKINGVSNINNTDILKIVDIPIIVNNIAKNSKKTKKVKQNTI